MLLTFGLQIKSSASEWRVTREDAFNVLRRSNLPLFLGVVSREQVTLSIYSLLPRFCLFWELEAEAGLTFVPGGTVEQFHRPDCKRGRAFLGPPILSVEISRLDMPGAREALWETISKVMCAWVQMECQAIAWQRNNVPIVPMPESFETNRPFGKLFPVIYCGSPIVDRSGLAKILNASILELEALSRILGQAGVASKLALDAPAREAVNTTKDHAGSLLKELHRLTSDLFPSGPPDMAAG